MMGGFLKDMNDRIKQNRDLRRGKVDLEELYREYKKHPDKYNIKDINDRIEFQKSNRVINNKNATLIRIITVGLVVLTIISVLIFL